MLPAYLAEAWRARGIAFYLAWRDILVRYKQTLIGIVWVVARPLLVAIAFAFVFGRIASLSSSGTPYLLFVLVAMLPWQFFTAAIGQGAESLTSNAAMITKIYFPRLLLPVAAVLGSLFDFFMSLPLLGFLLIWFGLVPSPSAILPVLFWIVVLVAMSFGVGAILGALNALYRDVRHVVPFILQFALFISPIGYGVDSVPEGVRPYFCLNPLAGLFEALRSALLGTPLLVPGWALAWSVAFAAGSAMCGILVFWRAERRIVDVI